MEKLKARYSSVCNALERLNEDMNLLNNKNSSFYTLLHRQLRSSAIQSLEFCIESVWKFLKEYLIEIAQITQEPETPREVFKLCAKVGLITASEYKKFMEIIADRNMTSHTYDEAVAEQIAVNLSKHSMLMGIVIQRIKI